MGDFKWVDDISVDPTTMFNVGSRYRMGLLYDSPSKDIHTFSSYDKNGSCKTYEDGRGVLHFGNSEFTPLYIESQLLKKGLSLYDLCDIY